MSFSRDILHLIISWDRGLQAQLLLQHFSALTFRSRWSELCKKGESRVKQTFSNFQSSSMWESDWDGLRVHMGQLRQWVTVPHGRDTSLWYCPEEGLLTPRCSKALCSALGQIPSVLCQEPITANGLICRRRYLAAECRHGDGMGSSGLDPFLSPGCTNGLSTSQRKELVWGKTTWFLPGWC